MKKWLDNYGKKENANEGRSSAPKEWRGEGYSNVGRNYSPAWGGQFQLGGNVYPVNYVPQAQDGFITLSKDAETLDKLAQKKSFEKNITNQPQIKQGKKEISKTNNSEGRSFWETASQFIPVYETYLDVKDIIQGAFTGDTEMRNRGIIGLSAPVSGKAVMGGLDYFTEKTQGKETADYNAQARKDIVNGGAPFTKALFKKYGWGGYDKWVADGKPHLDPVYEQGGSIPQAQDGISFLPQQDPEMMYADRFNTQLNKDEQNLFAEWVAKESERQGRDIMMDKGAYDVQGFWKSGDYKKMDQDNHGTDTWKKPNHPTFSNQSRYHGVDGFYGGNWKPDGGYQPSKQSADMYGPSYYNWMFGREPERPEHLDASRYMSGANKPSPLYFAMGGKLSKAQKGKKVIIDGKEYDASSDEYRDLYRFGPNQDGKGGIGYYDKNGILVTNKMTLPEVVIFKKDKDTKDYYDRLSIPDRYAFEQLAKNHGPVNVKQEEGEGMFSGTKGHYNAPSNTITVDPGTHFDGAFISELAHKLQYDKQGIFDVTGDWIFNDLPDYLTGEDPYKDPSAMEYEAHSKIEPGLRDEYYNYKSDDEMGYNYNKFQLGGSIPGSVGFTYARTNSPAPSNGPYAKKTKASAQNGQEMSFYQHGLDWKPKSISKNGGWLDEYIPEAQGGLNIPGVTDFKMPLNRTDAPGLSIQEKQRQDAAALEMQRRNEATAKRQFVGKGKASTPESERSRAIKNKAYAAQNAPYVNIDENANLSQAFPDASMTGELRPGSRAAKTQEGIDDMITALEYAGYAEGLGTLGELGYGALKKGISTLPGPKTITLSKILDNSKLNTKLANNLYANRILEEELIAPNVSFKGLETNLPEGSRIINHAGSPFLQKDGRMYYIQEYDDRFRLLDNTDYFVPHPKDLYPSKSKLKDLKKYNISDKSDPIYHDNWYKFNQTTEPIDDWIIHNDLGKIKGNKTWWKKSEPYKGMANRSLFDQPEGRHVYAKQSALESALERPLDEHRELIGDIIKKGNVPRGGLTITPTGESFLPNVQGVKTFTYNPLTKSMERGIFKKKEGGVIKDDRGQWDHPGEITEIGSNRITMQGVPYPVLGISDLGDTQMMYPGEEYKFKGKKVTEFPITQKSNKKENGGWLSQYK